MFDLVTTAGTVAVGQQVVGGTDGFDDLRLAAAAGFTSVSLHTSRLPGGSTRRWREELAALDLLVVGVMGIRGILDDPIDAEETLRLAGAMGARYVSVTTGPRGGRSRTEADRVCTTWFERMQPLAGRLGLRLALEPLHPLLADLSYVHTVRHAAAIVASAPGAGILLDTGHVWWDPDLEEDLPAATDAIVTVQLSDVPPAAIAHGAYDRVALGTGVVPNADLVARLLRLGYDGPFEYESLCPGEDRVALLGAERRSITAMVDGTAALRTHHTLDVDGLRFHVVVQGEGPLVVLAHGFPGLWYSWRHQLDALAAAGYRAVAFDQRGFGRTDVPSDPDGWDHDHVTADLLAISSALGEERAVYVGHDVGGPQVYELAVRHPGRVQGIAVLSTPYDPERSPIRPTDAYAAIADEHFLHKHYFQAVGPADRELAGDVEGFLRRLFVALGAGGRYLDVWEHPSDGRGYLDVLPPDDGPLPWLTDDDLSYYVSEYTRTGFTGGLGWYRAADRSWERRAGRTDPTITVPALFIAGTDDPVPAMAAPGTIDRMRAAIPDLRAVVSVPGAGHWVQQEQPDAVAAALLRFLATLT